MHHLHQLEAASWKLSPKFSYKQQRHVIHTPQCLLHQLERSLGSNKISKPSKDSVLLHSKIPRGGNYISVELGLKLLEHYKKLYYGASFMLQAMSSLDISEKFYKIFLGVK